VAAFADLSQRLGKTYTPDNGLAGTWSYSELKLQPNDVSLGCPQQPNVAVPKGQTGAWQILISLNNIGNFDYRATLDGKVVFLCSAPAGVNSGSLPQASSPSGVQSQGSVTYEAPIIAYVDAKSGNVYVTSMRPNPGPTALTEDSVAQPANNGGPTTSVLYNA